MKIGALVHMYPPHHNAGAEHMLHAILSELVKRGYECVVVINQGKGFKKLGLEPYVLDGVKVTEDARALKGIDVLITHLDRTEDAEKIATERNIPLVQIFHNHERPTMVEKCDLAVYNTRHLLQDAPMDFDCPTIVLHPPVWADRYKVEDKYHVRKYITLINLSRAKGADMFYALAKAMPDHQFLGVKGSYGGQVMPPSHLPNVTIIENQKDIRTVYCKTKILLMPSNYESYGRCAVEAAVNGIPTIAHPTKGLREALLEDKGVFPVPDSPSWKCAVEYVEDTYPARVRDALWVARCLDPSGDIDRFEEALLAVVERHT